MSQIIWSEVIWLAAKCREIFHKSVRQKQVFFSSFVIEFRSYNFVLFGLELLANESCLNSSYSTSSALQLHFAMYSITIMYISFVEFFGPQSLLINGHQIFQRPQAQQFEVFQGFESDVCLSVELIQATHKQYTPRISSYKQEGQHGLYHLLIFRAWCCK